MGKSNTDDLSEVNNFESHITGLKIILERYKKMLEYSSDLECKLSKLKKVDQEKDKRIKGLDDDLKNVSFKNNELGNSIDGLEINISSLNKNNTELIEENKKMKGNIKKLEGELENANSKNEKLDNYNIDHKKTITSLTNKNAQLNVEGTTLKETNNQINSKLKILEKKFKSLSDQSKILKRNIANKNEEIDKVVNSLSFQGLMDENYLSSIQEELNIDDSINKLVTGIITNLNHIKSDPPESVDEKSISSSIAKISEELNMLNSYGNTIRGKLSNFKDIQTELNSYEKKLEFILNKDERLKYSPYVNFLMNEIYYKLDIKTSNTLEKYLICRLKQITIMALIDYFNKFEIILTKYA